MTVYKQVEVFLLKYCPLQTPLLLALSGGPDSLYLFYVLLAFRKQYGIPFHVAHVDHRWRQESEEEAQILKELANRYHVPFHLKVLNPALLKGNLEAACREERYAFFTQLCQQCPFQGVLTGHHQDDQAETIFKRVLEGAHWSRLSGLQPESWMKDLRILRPLLDIAKKDIQVNLSEDNLRAFDDPSNRYLKFLRARLRETIFPRLNQEFGKQVQKSLITMGKDAQELNDYFHKRLNSILEYMIRGPWGICLDLQTLMPETQLEVKYLLRLLCKHEEIFLSREIIEQAAQALQLNKANLTYAMGSHQIRIDRQRIFMMPSPVFAKEDQMLSISPGDHLLGDWKLSVSEDIYFVSHQTTSWKEGWKGQLISYLPIGNYMIGYKNPLETKIINAAAIKKRWSQAKVPAFLYDHYPLIWIETEICHEFLTGKSLFAINEGSPCLKIELHQLPNS